MAGGGPLERVRVDKWLWAARFFKTRALASEAVDGGRVHLHGQRVKPAKEVKVGDRLEITTPGGTWDVTVTALADKRGSASVAQGLYEESEESRLRRAEQQEARRLAADPSARLKGRPTKRDRRLIHRFTEG